MKTREDVLRTLARLSPSDRTWIVENLPRSARAQLLEEGEIVASPPADASSGMKLVSVPSKPQVVKDFARASAIVDLENEPADRIARLLSGEPAWAVHAVLFAHDWPWRDAVLQQMSAGQRDALMRLTSGHVRYASKLVDSVVAVGGIVVALAVERVLFAAGCGETDHEQNHQ